MIVNKTKMNSSFIKTTEQTSKYDHLENMSVSALLQAINQEDQSVAMAVAKAMPQIEVVVHQVVERLKNGGRLFYIGAGTSGRIGVLDASECPPTFGVPFDLVVGIIAGGDTAIRKAVENAEDSTKQAWLDLKAFDINSKDMVVGIAASGTTPYVVSGLAICNENNIATACVTCNQGSPLAQTAQFPIEVVVGPEFVTGSSRMKAGTAQKLVLNMISTTSMIQLGKVKGNKMVDMQLSNDKLVDRGTKMIVAELGIAYEAALHLLQENGSVRKAIAAYHKNLHS
jgi:N-acetylmuramic acid 6-phosphate etherase